MRIARNAAWLMAGCLCLFGSTMPWAVGGEVVIRDIRVEGIARTRPRTVLRQLPFAVGDVWRDEDAATGERWLRNLGLFSEAHIQPPDERGVVVVRVHERWSLWLLPTATRRDNGASSVGLSLDEYNLWGLGHHLSVGVVEDTGTNFSDARGQTLNLGYDWPRIADSMLGLNVSGSWGQSRFDAWQNGQFVARYLRDARSLSAVFRYALGPVEGEGWGVRAGFAGGNTAFRLKSGAPQSDVVGVRKRTFLTGVSYRNVDDRITWLTGMNMDWSLAVSHRALGSSINVWRQELLMRDYIPIGRNNTINLRLDGGLAGGEVLRDGLFDIGNRNQLRGYFPGEVQGKRYALGTVEGRFLPRPDSNIQWVAFTDAAWVGGRIGAPNRVFAGVGGGLRWTLRWLVRGTIRADAAYGFATKRWRFYLGTRQAF
jgi:outer membrane protein assembly factor BamA